MACGGFGSLLRCCVCPMAVQPIFVPLVEEERVGGQVIPGEWLELEELKELKGGSGARWSIAVYLREAWRIGKGLK